MLPNNFPKTANPVFGNPQILIWKQYKFDGDCRAHLNFTYLCFMEEHDTIITKVNSHHIPKGTTGTIVYVYERGAYVVEVSVDGETFIETYKKDEIELTHTMEYPNKIYVSEYKGENGIIGQSHFVIVVAAENREVARNYVKNQIGFDADPVWLMNSVYPTIYSSDSQVRATPQVKILYNGNAHF